MTGRRVYVLHVYAGGPATIEEVATGRTATLPHAGEVMAAVEEWFAAGPCSRPASDGLSGEDPGVED